MLNKIRGFFDFFITNIFQYNNLLNKQLKLNSNDLETFNKLGIEYKNKKDYTNAKKYFLKAIELNPNYANSYNNLGILYTIQKDYTNAKKYFLKAIELNPIYDNAHNNLGVLYKIQNDYINAKKYYLEAIRINPKHFNAFNNLGALHQIQKDTKIAEEYFLKAIKLNPLYVKAYNNLGNLYFEIKEYYKASLCYLKVLEIKPKNKNANRKLNEIKSNNKFSTDLNKPSLFQPFKKLPGISKFLVGILAILLLPLTLVIGLPVLAAIRDRNIERNKKKFVPQNNLEQNHDIAPKTIKVNKNKGTALVK